MKKQKTSLTLHLQSRHSAPTWGASLSLLLPGIPLVVGLWGMVGHMIASSPAVPIVISLLGLVGALWLGHTQRQGIGLVGLLTLFAALGLVCHAPLQKSLAVFCNALAQWLTETTGVYHLPFTAEGSAVPVLLFLAAASGLALGALVQLRRPVWLLLLLPPLLPEAMGFLHGGWFLALYFLGAILLLIKDVSGAGRPLLAASLGVVLSGGVVLGALAAVPPITERTQAGSTLAHTLHHWRYESAANPMPEGQLENLSPYAPTQDAALAVTMKHWTPLYIRGYTGTVYTGHSWESVSPADTAAQAQTLYALQKDAFFPALQVSAGWQAADVPSSNRVTVETLGACRAHAWVPYGAGQLSGYTPDPAQLTAEGLLHPKETTLHAELWPIEDSYLLQGQLATVKAPAYRRAETVYRQWVYDTCCNVPEEVYTALENYVQLEGTDLSTTRARDEITDIVQKLLTYREGTLTAAGEEDFISYVLRANPQGYSVHYATLATLLMRCCGIPARYVEGYVVTPAMAEAMKDGDTLTLRQVNSHAWCEYYLDGVGWLPFDTVPGYTDFLSYPLPSDGTPTGDDSAQGTLQLTEETQKPLPKPLQVSKEPDKAGHSHWIFIREAANLLWMILLLLLAALALRILLLRRRLQQKKAGFAVADPRLAAGRILAYSAEVLTLLGFHGDNRPLSQQHEALAALLHSEDDLAEITALAQEIWFSDHAIDEEQRQLALRWLHHVTQVWQQDTPRIRRWRQRWLQGRVI